VKLCFSTRYRQMPWSALLQAAQESGVSALELFAREGAALTYDSPLRPQNASAARRELHARKLSLACLTTDLCLTQEGALEKLEIYLRTARNLSAGAVCVTGEPGETLTDALRKAVSLAEREGCPLLLETCGAFADTELLRRTLDAHASDFLGACWDLQSTAQAGETPEATITHLGAYVRHVHYADFTRTENGAQAALAGEGELPFREIVLALRSVNYAQAMSLVWDPAWMPDLSDLGVLLPHFQSYLSRFEDTVRTQKHIFWNKAHTGRFLWEKDGLIDLTFPQVLDTMVEEFPDQICFRYTTLDYTRTYAQFRDDVDTFARALIALGVKPGHHVAVWATNVPQWFVAFWAVTKIGAVLVTMNTAYKIHEAEYLLRQSDAHTLITIEYNRDSDYAGIIRELCPELAGTVPGRPLHAARLPFLRNVVTVDFSMPGCLTWEGAMALADRVPIEEVYRRAAAIRPDDVCNMQYTSGTTGFPKGVMLTHHNVVNNGKCIGDRMDLSTADRMMIQVPMFHCFGMVLAMTACMTHGSSQYPLPYFSAKSGLACIDREKITCFHGVPTMFIAMLEHADFPRTDFSHMRTGIMAGSPCPVAVMRDVLSRMHMNEITIVYGQTEASPGCTMSSTDDPLEVRVGTVGRALPGVECKIVDPETGNDLPDDVTGEFVARGYNIMKGYYKMPSATASAIDKDGWLHTGDLAARTPEGNYRITGRLKDMIIRGGENIYPKEIEEFIYTHPKVRDVQVIGVPDQAMGEEVMACIILKDGMTMTVQELKQFVSAHIARHKVPRYVEFVTEFPTNAAGKIMKYKMREQAVEKLSLQKAAGIVTA